MRSSPREPRAPGVKAAEPIALVARDGRDVGDWIAALSAAMPDETVRPFAELAGDERSVVRLAVVVDPDPAELAMLPALEWVHSTWAGVERLVSELPVDLPVVRLVDPRLSETMAEAVLTAVLWLHRDGPAYARQQRDGVWRAHGVKRAESRSVAVLGLGALGRRAAERLAANGFRVLGWSRTPKAIGGIDCDQGEAGLARTLSAADIAVLLLPLTDGTRGLLDAGRLSAIRPGAALVNFGRGAVIDERALLAALDSGAVGHAMLDVFSTEPLPSDHPFWSHDRVTVWPHVSAPTDRDTASAIVAAAVARWRRTGKHPPAVERERGY